MKPFQEYKSNRWNMNAVKLARQYNKLEALFVLRWDGLITLYMEDTVWKAEPLVLFPPAAK